MLGPDELLESVTADEGLDDYGDPVFREGFDRLLWSLANEANLNEIGDIAAETMVRRLEDVYRDALVLAGNSGCAGSAH